MWLRSTAVSYTHLDVYKRQGLVPFLKELHRELPGIKTALTTNASLLDEYSAQLAEAGIHSLNISLDTLDPEKFARITRIGTIDKVFAGIRAAKSAGIGNIKLNAVLIRDCLLYTSRCV